MAPDHLRSHGDSVRQAERDAELLRRIRANDDSAFAALIDQYAQPLHDYAYVIVRDADLASDIVQDVLVRVWTLRETLVVRGTVAEYLFRAVRNRARNAVRDARTHARVHDLLQAQHETRYVVTAHTAASAADAAILTEEFAAAVSAAVKSLTPRVRETFLLSRVHRMTYAEIANTLDVSLATVQSQMSRAVKQILAYLAPFR